MKKILILMLSTQIFFKEFNLSAMGTKAGTNSSNNNNSLILGLTIPQSIGVLLAGSIVIILLQTLVGSYAEFKREVNLTEFVNNFLKAISENPELQRAIKDRVIAPINKV